MLVENLETRRLLSVTVENNGGELTITGDDAKNFVNVRLKQDGDTLVVRTATAVEEATTTTEAEEYGPHLPFDLTDVTTTEFSIANDGITSIVMDLGGEDDRACVSPNVELPATINGGEGNDDLGGGAGDDTIHGDGGNDHLRGGKGADNLFGDDGNDFIAAADGVTDVVDGGADTTDADGSSGDTAIIDPADGETPDTVTDVEATHAVTPGEHGPHFGFGGGFHGGFGHHHHGPPHSDDDSTDTGSGDTGTGDTGTGDTTTGITTALAPAVSSSLNTANGGAPVRFMGMGRGPGGPGGHR